MSSISSSSSTLSSTSNGTSLSSSMSENHFALTPAPVFVGTSSSSSSPYSTSSTSSFNFKITSLYAPYLITQEDDCPIAYQEFSKLAYDHFQYAVNRHSAPYFVALIEDRSHNCALFDLESLKNFYNYPGRVGEGFSNPKNKSLCERILILGINKLGSVAPFATCSSLRSFENLSQVILLKDLYYKNMRRVESPPCLYESFLKNLSDEQSLNWLDLVFKDSWFSFYFNRKNLDNFLTSGSLTRMQKLIEQLDKKYPDNEYVQQYLAHCFVGSELSQHPHFSHLKNLEKAANHYEKSIQAAVDKSLTCNTHQDLANLYKDLKRYDKAFECCQAALRIRPDDPTLYVLLGKIFLEEGRHIEAIGALEKSLDLSSISDSRIFLAEAYKLLGDFSEAKKQLGIVLDNRNTHHRTRALCNLAEIARITSDFETAHLFLHQAEGVLSIYAFDSEKQLIQEARRQLAKTQKIEEDPVDSDLKGLNPSKKALFIRC